MMILMRMILQDLPKGKDMVAHQCCFSVRQRVEVPLSGSEVKEDDEQDKKTISLKVLPPWMIKQGMNLTKEQHGDAKTEPKMESSSATEDEKKPNVNKEVEKSIQDEYLKAYYASFLKGQEEQEASKRVQQELEFSNIASEEPFEWRVGMKSKCQDDGNDDVELEEASYAGNSIQALKIWMFRLLIQ